MNPLSDNRLLLILLTLTCYLQIGLPSGYGLERKMKTIDEPSSPHESYTSDFGTLIETSREKPVPVTFRFSYVCPPNGLLTGNKECKYLIIQLPDKTFLKTTGFGSNKSHGTRYTFHPVKKPKDTMMTLTLTPNMCPYVITIYPMTGYVVDQPTDPKYCYHLRERSTNCLLESLFPQQVTIPQKKLAKKWLNGVRLTHDPQSVCKNMRLLYRYEDTPFHSLYPD